MTPAGSPTCPYCQQAVALDLPLPFGLITCSKCAERLWLLTLNSERAFFPYEAAELVRHLFNDIDIDDRFAREFGLDILDVTEMLIEFETALDETIC